MVSDKHDAPATLEQKMEFVAQLPLIMDRAGRLGLWRTMHALHDAVRIAGWEIADLVKVERERGDGG